MKQFTFFKRKTISLFFFLLTFNIAFSQNDNGSIDAPGDIAIVIYNDLNDDTLGFVLLDDAPNNTKIVFTDTEWTGAGFSTAEGDLTWTNTGATLTKGTVIVITNANGTGISTNHGTTTETHSGFTCSNGDQVYAFTGTRAAPGTFLAFYGDENSLNGAETATLTSTGLTNGTTAHSRNAGTQTIPGYYNGTTVFNGTLAQVAIALNTDSNWLFASSAAHTVPANFTGSAFVTAVAPTVSTTAASAVANTSATLAGNASADGGDAITTRGIVYSITTTNSNPLIGGAGVTNDTNGAGTGTFNESITGLAAGTQYSFKAYAINGIGTTYGAATTFTTTGKGWTGATNTNWATASNWSPNSIPIASDNLVIPNVGNKPIISGSTGAVANNITIDASATVTVESGGSLIINGTATVNGNFIYKVNVTDNKWHLVSSPVVNEQYNDAWNTTNGIALNLPNEAVSNYINTTDADGDWVYFQDGGATTTFASGKGYSLKRTGAGDYTFIGTFPAPPVNVSITANNIGTPASENRWTLVGNPYPAHIDIPLFLSTNATPLTNTHENVYVWNASAGAAGEYQPLNTGQIHPGQAFFVNANVASTSVTFTKAMQSDQNGITFYRSSNPKITLLLNNGTNTKSTEINYVADKTTGLDPRFDAGTFTGQASSFNLYTHLVSNSEGVNFMKQSLPNSNYQNMVIPVGVNVAANTEITFTADALNLPTGLKVFLEDREANTFTRLDEANSNYTVTSSAALNGIGRFYLHTAASVLSVNDRGLENVSVYKFDNSTLRIVGLQNSKTAIKIFTILGKQVLNTAFQSNGVTDISLPKLASGVYIVQLQTDKGSLSKKIILE